MLAYACDPVGSGEHWLGWGWAETAAKFCDVTLFTPGKAREAIQAKMASTGITPRFIEIPQWLRWCSERLGHAGLWWRKIAWAKRAAAAIQARDFDIVHHTTFHTFRAPFCAASLGIPSVWGPMAGGEHTPPGFDKFLGDAAASERKRDQQNRRWLAWERVQRALRDTSILLPSNRTTLEFLPKFAQEKSTIVPPNTLRDDARPVARQQSGVRGRLRLIYVGNCVATRSIPLVLHAMRDSENVSLTVVGTGPALEAWRTDAAGLGLADRVRFTGQVSREQLPALYADADALVFPALRDSGGSSLLEAMSQGLPVICLDWAGPGEMVDATSGIKIRVETPAQVIRDLAEAFTRFRDNPSIGTALAESAHLRTQAHFTWSAKQRILERVYGNLMKH